MINDHRMCDPLQSMQKPMHTPTHMYETIRYLVTHITPTEKKNGKEQLSLKQMMN